jgi:YbbR domain-containing protein
VNIITKFLKWLIANPGTKVASVLMAVILWFFAQSELTQQKLFNVPVEVVNIPAELSLTSLEQGQVEVRVEGVGKQLIMLSDDAFTAQVDAQGLSAGTFTENVLPQDILLPTDGQLRVIEIASNSDVTFQLQERAKKRLRIQAEVIGLPAKGYVIYGKPLVFPDNVMVSGQESVLSAAEEVRTDTVDCSGATSDVTARVKLYSPIDDLRILDPQEATVTVFIQPVEQQKFTTSKIMVRGNPQESGKVIVDQVKPQLVLEGAKDKLLQLTEDEFVVWVDVSKLSAGMHILPLHATLPGGVKLVDITPEEVAVEVMQK